MTHHLSRSTFVLAIAAWMLHVNSSATADDFHLNGRTFTLPPGFEIELVAGPPLVNRPIVADVDEKGRLYVADSSGSNDRVEVQLKQKPHRIVRLESTKGDGRYDHATVYADKIMFPEGAMWLTGSLYVAAPPSIWKLTDTTGQGTADQRIEWFKGKTLTGCANDLHGPYLGRDGWIYWCKGAFAKQTYERPGRPPFVTKAAHIFRCRPDGSDIEPVMTGGMDNPVEVVFTPGGERLFTTTFLQTPGGGRRDGIIHAIYGGIYGKDHAPIYEHKWTGPSLMPVLTHLGPAAPSGLALYESRGFGAEYQGNLFAALFNMRKVTRHVLTPSGATFALHDQDFLVSPDQDFHPTDVLEDADGSLLVLDTGGWYKLCCPSSQLHKPDILGAIYRIRRKGAPRPDDPSGLKLAWPKMGPAELTRLLDDSRPVVRSRAIQWLAAAGAAAVPALSEVLRSSRSPQARWNAVWSMTRIADPTARAAVRLALADPNETVRQAAIHSVSVWRDREARPELVRLLQSESLHNRRAAAEALGRIGGQSAVPALLEAAGKPGDRVLEHSLTFALIELADRERTMTALNSDNLRTRRTALVALDQMDGGGLKPEQVAQELVSADRPLKESAWWIAGRHPEWGSALAGFLRQRLESDGIKEAERDELVHHLARFARTAAIQELLAERLRDPSSSREVRRIALRAMSQASLRDAPRTWIDGLCTVLAGDDRDLIGEAVSTARALTVGKSPPAKLTPELLRIGNDAAMPSQIRLSALAAMPGGLAEVQAGLFMFLRARLDPDEPVAARSLASVVLSQSKLTSQQLIALTDVLKTTGPMEVDRLLEAFAQSSADEIGFRLIAALKLSPARSALRADTLKRCLAKFGAAVQHQAVELYAVLNIDTAKQEARLEELLAQLQGGDVRRGQAVFNSSKAACSACHAIGYMGGKIGPDLTHIAKIRNERDLLESIVFPSASIVRSYEPVAIGTKDGKLLNGLVTRDLPDEIVLVTGANQETRIARDDIEFMRPSNISVMPAGLDQQLTPQDLANLVAFLKTCK
jgi:putative membrane-bound dehydrogenase-like protein